MIPTRTYPHLLALDPGLRGCGLAYFDANGVLLHAKYLKNPVKKGGGPEAWLGFVEAMPVDLWRVEHFVSEYPQVYRAGASKGDPDDLLQLASVVAVFTANVVAKDYLAVRPREWKGQVPKDVHHARLVKALDDHEKLIVEESAPPSLRHNVLDAVGIGKYWFGLQRRAATRAT